MSKLYSLSSKIARLAAAEAELGKHHTGSKAYFSALDEYAEVRDDLRIAIREYESDEYQPAEKAKRNNVAKICSAFGIRYDNIFYEMPKKEANE